MSPQSGILVIIHLGVIAVYAVWLTLRRTWAFLFL